MSYHKPQDLAINTRTLDHIVYLTPPGTLEDAVRDFRAIGFQVLPGGVHSDGLTANALIVFEDHSYIEIINFTHPPYYYPPGSPLRLKRDSHPWSEAYKKPGLVDFAFLGNGSLDPSKSVSSTINERAKKDGIELKYVGEKPGGRTRTDGQVLKWLISSPEKGGGVLPFFCGDITPRKLRVPVDPPSNTEHPFGVNGASSIHILVRPGPDLSHLYVMRDLLSTAVGVTPKSVNDSGMAWTWDLDTPGNDARPQLILGVPHLPGEQKHVEEHGEGIYKVTFRTKDGGRLIEIVTQVGTLW